MADFITTIQQNPELTPEEQKKIGQAVEGKMGSEHTNFLKHVIDLLDRKEIDAYNPSSLLNQDVYDGLDDEWQARVDKALPNITDQLRRIEGFYRSTATPNSSPQLETMIEHLWQMKQQIEEHHDVFKI